MKIRTTVVSELAARRVRRGVQWLNNNAPYDWERRMLAIGPGGQAHVRWRRIVDSEGPLQFAFEPMGELASETVLRVTLASVVNHFDLSARFLFAHGFEDVGLMPNVADEYANVLAHAWRVALFSYARPAHSPRRHSLVLSECEPQIAHPVSRSLWQMVFLLPALPVNGWKRLRFKGQDS